MTPTVSVLIPVFNEARNIPLIHAAVLQAFLSTGYQPEFIFIDDGSEDDSAACIRLLASQHHNIVYSIFSRNFGKDNALSAGLKHASGEAVITIDADLQHPPEMIPDLIALWEQGHEVIYAFREKKNEHSTRFNRLSSEYFYRIINNLSDLELEDGVSDYRLLDRKVVQVLNQLSEDEPFYRGLVKWVGFRQKGIPYIPHARKEGETKYNTKLLAKLAVRGITSFSTKPLYLAAYIGFIFSFASLLYIPYIIYSFYFGHPISGWASVIATIAFFGGLQLMILGLIGVYLGKLFMQSKHRPQYIIRETNRPISE